ncbi:MAG: sulfotransferase [Natronomonas sp.]|uniref:sulfotransferase n=1 Tax=Natronomonas sp. TaxID=2184060 RepID=UPI00286FD821|nr:sulfotransferase [Natronomonas sp.]MDR9432189.1 sulfotransferase [Natronomonas sp.]
MSGLRKSGTSMVKNLLDGHPELFTYPPNELHFFRYSDHLAAVKDKKEMESNPSALLDRLAKTQFVRRMGDESTTASDYRAQLDLDVFDEQVAAHSPETYPEVYEALFESMAAASGHFDGGLDNVRPATKSVLQTEFFPELRQWFPDLKFVYVLRNPYGHFASARNSMRLRSGGGEGSEMGLISDPYPFIGSELRRMELSYYFARKFERLYPDHFYILIYDRILEYPEPTLRELASFLDVEYHESMTNPTICGEPWGGNSWYAEEFEGIDPGPLDHWLDDLSDGEIGIINDLFGDVLDDFGFDRLESNSSLLRPFHRSERPHTYIANRFAIYRQKHANA